MTRVLGALAVLALLAAGCSGDARPDPREPLSTPASSPDAPVWLRRGVVLEPGADGRLPVSVRWTYQGAGPEAFAVDRRRGLLYLDDELATALDLDLGAVMWEVGSPRHSVLEGGLASDGGDIIGRSGRGGVRFFAPFNFDLTVDPASGRRTAFHSLVGNAPRGELRPFPRPRPREQHVDVGSRRVVARGDDGEVLWRLRIHRRVWFWAMGPVAVPGGVAFVLSTGLLVVLDWSA